MSDKRFEDIPLPGFVLESSVRDVASPRPYDPTLPPTQAAIAAFWSKVVKAPGDGCWVWVGAIASGYGRISWRTAGVSRTEYAHRFALLIAGQLPDGAIGEHRCNEPLCVRVGPGHLIASNQSANLRYAVACGRTGTLRGADLYTDRHARALAVRDAVKNGWDAGAYARASGTTVPGDTPPLF